MQVQGLEAFELENICLDVLEVIVGEINPLESLRAPHNVEKYLGETFNRANLVVLEEDSLRRLPHNDLLLGLSLRLLNFAASKRPLVVHKRDVVVQKDQVDLLGLRSPDHLLFGLSSLCFLLCVFLVDGPSILVLNKVA